MASTDNNDEKEIFFSFFNQIAVATVEQVGSVLAGWEAVEHALLAVTQVVFVGHGDNAGSFLLLQVRNEISQRPEIYKFLNIIFRFA